MPWWAGRRGEVGGGLWALEVGPRQKGRGHGFGGAESEFSAKFRWAGQRGLRGRVFSQAEGQVMLLVVPAVFRQSFWQGPYVQKRRPLSPILALPRLLWDFGLKPSLGCEGRLRACGLRPALPFLSLAKGAEVKLLVCTFTSALPRTRRARRDRREQQAPPGWWVAVLIREGACLRGLCWAPKANRPPQPPDRTLTVHVEAFTGPVSPWSSVSSAPRSLKAAFLKQLLPWEPWAGRTSESGRGMRRPWLPGCG